MADPRGRQKGGVWEKWRRRASQTSVEMCFVSPPTFTSLLHSGSDCRYPSHEGLLGSPSETVGGGNIGKKLDCGDRRLRVSNQRESKSHLSARKSKEGNVRSLYSVV